MNDCLWLLGWWWGSDFSRDKISDRLLNPKHMNIQATLIGFKGHTPPPHTHTLCWGGNKETETEANKGEVVNLRWDMGGIGG